MTPFRYWPSLFRLCAAARFEHIPPGSIPVDCRLFTPVDLA